jgi:hypothetical protein
LRLHFDEGERQIVTARLGLAEDASDEDLATAMARWMAEEPSTETETEETEATASTEGLEDDQDVVIVDVASYTRLVQRDAMAGQIEAANHIRDRNEVVEEAIADGKFGPSRRDHYRARYDSDPEGTIALIGRLQRNTVPLELRGVDAAQEEADTDAYPKEWLPEIHAQQAQGQRQRVHRD